VVEEIESSIFQILNCGKVRLFDSLNPTEIISLLAPEECWDEKRSVFVGIHQVSPYSGEMLASAGTLTQTPFSDEDNAVY